jgi:hypothetical protein
MACAGGARYAISGAVVHGEARQDTGGQTPAYPFGFAQSKKPGIYEEQLFWCVEFVVGGVGDAELVVGVCSVAA